MLKPAIRVRDLVKDYDVYKRPADLALEVISRKPRHTTFRALDRVGFDVAKGEVLGIIGSNGAGKSTLLKIVTGVLEPTSGSVEIRGRVTAILELGLGFHPEYSGRDNIYQSGLLYGMTRKEIDRKLKSIIDFSGIGEFIERPVKTYSSGMHSRLAFSIATAVDPDILIIDEALAAGDASFVQKCLRRIRELCSGGRTVLLVSHGTGLLAQLCNRIMWMERGAVRMVGPAIQVVQAYDLAAHQSADNKSWIEDIDERLAAASAQAAWVNEDQDDVSADDGDNRDEKAGKTKKEETATGGDGTAVEQAPRDQPAAAIGVGEVKPLPTGVVEALPTADNKPAQDEAADRLASVGQSSQDAATLESETPEAPAAAPLDSITPVCVEDTAGETTDAPRDTLDTAAKQKAEQISETADADEDEEAAEAGKPLPKSRSGKRQAQPVVEAGRKVFRRGNVFIENVEMLDHHGTATDRLTLLHPFKIRINYHVEGELPKATLGFALAFNQRHDLTPVIQAYTQNIRPFETRETYLDAVDRFPPSHRGTIIAAFNSMPLRKGDYFLSIGLLPNEPATWEFYEYRHFYYTFSVDDAGMDVGAPVFLSPAVYHIDRDAEDAKALPVKIDTPPPRTDGSTLRNEIDTICKQHGGYPGSWPRHTSCPACETAALYPKFEKYGFDHVRCGDCGFVAVDPYPPAEVISALYAGAYYTQVREHFELPLLREAGEATPYSAPENLLKNVIRRVTEGKAAGSWLDVGGGLGAFAQLIRRERPYWKVMLNEKNARSVSIAHQEFGLDVTSDDASALFAAKRSFDVISSVAVLEHVPKPLELLSGYARLIVPGGWLVTVVPHFTELNASVSMGSSPNVVPPYHTSLFGRRSLRRLMERLPGFELVDLDEVGPAAFDLVQHVDFGDKWDISIPSHGDPSPRSVQLEPYDPDTSSAISALVEANTRLGDYFARNDGRLFLIAYCRKIA